MSLLKPPALMPGDRIAIIAPASPFPREEFDAGLGELKALGFEPIFDERVFDRDGYLAGDAVTRARAFAAAWTDPSIRALVAARGGYGSAQLLPFLDRSALMATPKLLIGYSDITALLSFVTTRCGITAVHGPTVAGRLGRGAEGYDRTSFIRAVSGSEPLGEIAPPTLESMKPGEVSGPLLGGNLTQLAASLGTPFAFDPPAGCVLFLEDVNERPYRVDRLLTQLRQAGVLSRASGLVFGTMTGCDEADGSLRALDAIARIVRDFSGPVVWGMTAGHTQGPAITLPLGVNATLVAGPKPSLNIDEAAVLRTPAP